MMMNITDIIVLLAFLYFFYAGWRKGFLRTFLIPLSLVVACLFGYKYYQMHHDVVVSLAICVVGSFLLHLLSVLILKFWNSTVDDKRPPSAISGFLAGVFSILWGCGYLIILLLFIATIPTNNPWLKKAQEDVLSSGSYGIMRTAIRNKLPGRSIDVKKVAEALQDGKKFEELQSTEEFQTLQEDPILIKIFADEELNRQIRNKEYGKIITNPKMQALFNDKGLMTKILALSRKISEDPEEANDTSTPKMIEIPAAE